MITSAANQQMRSVRDLLNKGKERRRQQRFVVEGVRMIAETPTQLLDQIYISESFYKHPAKLKGLDLSRAVIVSDQVFNRIADTQTPQGILAVVRFPEQQMDTILKRPDALLLMLENIQDPGNLGTMMRTAEGAGVTGMIIGGNTVDIYNPKVVRATMGSLFRMPFVYVEDLCQTIHQARECGISVYAAHLTGSKIYDQADYRRPSAFLIGNEGSGLSAAVVEAASERVFIPMAGQLESLNAASASAVLVYEAARQRRRQVANRPARYLK